MSKEWAVGGLPLNKPFYEHLRARAKRGQFKLLEKHVVPPRSGRGVIVRKGQTARIVLLEGGQIADVAFYNADNRKEYYWSDYTFLVESTHLTTFSRVWSNMPWFRPMMTIIEDTVINVPSQPGFLHHCSLGSHCTPPLWEALAGVKDHNSCHINLLEAIAPFGLAEEDIHNNVNLFQKTLLDPRNGRDTLEKCDGKAGDYVEFYAEIDTLVAVSSCPAGDGEFGLDEWQKIVVRPLGIEIYETGTAPEAFPAWKYRREPRTHAPKPVNQPPGA